MRNVTTLVLIVATTLAAVLLDLYLYQRHLEAAFYAVPVLIAANRLPPRGVTMTALLTIFINFATAVFENAPVDEVVFSTLALVVVSYLALRLASQREETARRAREAEDARRQLQEFLGMVSHDLRQPLTTVLGFTQLLRRTDQRSASEQRALQAIEGAARQSNRLVADLLDAARIGSGHFAVHPSPMDLVSVVREVVEQQQEATSRHQLVLEAPERLEGIWDRARLRQLMTNLISNAIKYSPNGGDVRVAVQPIAGDTVEISVSDQGVGISADRIPLLFQPFSRVSHEPGVKGTGLGLYIAKAIVEAHGGRIWVVSHLGRGSTFHVRLPLRGERPVGETSSPGSERIDGTTRDAR